MNVIALDGYVGDNNVLPLPIWIERCALLCVRWGVGRRISGVLVVRVLCVHPTPSVACCAFAHEPFIEYCAFFPPLSSPFPPPAWRIIASQLRYNRRQHQQERSVQRWTNNKMPQRKSMSHRFFSPLAFFFRFDPLPPYPYPPSCVPRTVALLL